MRPGNFDLALPRRDLVARMLTPKPRRVRVRYIG